MTVTEKISSYFDSLIADGKLRPGDKLPSYGSISQKFSVTYATVQRAYKNMEVEGKIKIVNGIGSFLNGGEILDVDFYLTGTSFNFTEFQKIADSISKKHHLNLNIRLIDTLGKQVLDFTGKEHKICIREYNPWVRAYGSQMDFSACEGYDEFINEFSFPDQTGNNMRLPFFMIGFQGMVNPVLLEKIGFQRKITHFSTFEWWDEFAWKCRETGIFPALKDYRTDSIGIFPAMKFMEILMANERHGIQNIFKVPCFATKTGERLFRIMKDCAVSIDGQYSFRRGDCVLEPGIGSWITTQYKQEPYLTDKTFRIVPVLCGKKRMLRYGIQYLEAYVNHTVTEPEKKRIWIFLRELLSKPVQKKLMAVSGMISLRKDMKPSDHGWATREDFLFFFPEHNEILLSCGVLPTELYAVLATLHEQYEILGAGSSMAIREFMDKKILAYNTKKGE